MNKWTTGEVIIIEDHRHTRGNRAAAWEERTTADTLKEDSVLMMLWSSSTEFVNGEKCRKWIIENVWRKESTICDNWRKMKFSSILNLDYRSLFSLLGATRLARFLQPSGSLKISPELSHVHSFTSSNHCIAGPPLHLKCVPCKTTIVGKTWPPVLLAGEWDRTLYIG